MPVQMKCKSNVILNISLKREPKQYTTVKCAFLQIHFSLSYASIKSGIFNTSDTCNTQNTEPYLKPQILIIQFETYE